MACSRTGACRTEMLKLMVTESTDVPLRAGFDHATSPELVGDSFGGWSRLRAESPAFRSDIADTYDLWYLLSYADIRAALHDHELFSSRSVQYLGDSPQRLLPEELDPPEHAKYRRLLNAPLSPNAIRAREQQIRTLCVALIDEIEPFLLQSHLPSPDYGPSMVTAARTSSYGTLLLMTEFANSPQVVKVDLSAYNPSGGVGTMYTMNGEELSQQSVSGTSAQVTFAPGGTVAFTFPAGN